MKGYIILFYIFDLCFHIIIFIIIIFTVIITSIILYNMFLGFKFTLNI